MKHFLTYSSLFVLAVCIFAGCKQEPADEPAEVSRIRTITVAQQTVVLSKGGTFSVVFDVKDKDAMFVYAVSSDKCEVLLRKAGTTLSPAQFKLRSVVQGQTEGQYVATLEDCALADDYRIETSIAIKDQSGTIVKSNTFVVCTPSSLVTVESFKFRRADNALLSSDVVCSVDNTASVIAGHTKSYLSSMSLVALFECSGRVTVGGVEQQSGVTVNDFSHEVVYTVEYDGIRHDYAVRLTNFTGLPVVQIKTPSGQSINSKDVWVEGATISIDAMGLYDNLQECKMSIKGRGNTTWSWPKKPYNIKLDEKQHVLGMHKDRRWCLIANFMDRTLLRNRTAYYLAQQTSLAWTPDNRLVELFVNGVHRGQYLLTEKIRIDNNRVDITEMTPEDNSGEAVTGGYLLELDFHYDNLNQWRTPNGVPFSVAEPDEEVLNATQLTWIKNYIDQAEKAVYGADFADPVKGYAKYIDAQSFVDYWLVYEATVNHELGNPGSVFLHKDRGGKLVAGPAWDFDWGTFSYNCSPSARYGLFIQWAWWYDRLFDDPAFWALARERWKVLKPKFETALDFIDSERKNIELSAAENFKLWNPAEDGMINGDENMSWSAAVDRMYTILAERLSIIDKALR